MVNFILSQIKRKTTLSAENLLRNRMQGINCNDGDISYFKMSERLKKKKPNKPEAPFYLNICRPGQKEVYSCGDVKQLILVLLFIHCIIFHMNNCKPTSAPLWILDALYLPRLAEKKNVSQNILHSLFFILTICKLQAI